MDIFEQGFPKTAAFLNNSLAMGFIDPFNVEGIGFPEIFDLQVRDDPGEYILMEVLESYDSSGGGHLMSYPTYSHYKNYWEWSQNRQSCAYKTGEDFLGTSGQICFTVANNEIFILVLVADRLALKVVFDFAAQKVSVTEKEKIPDELLDYLFDKDERLFCGAIKDHLSS